MHAAVMAENAKAGRVATGEGVCEEAAKGGSEVSSNTCQAFVKCAAVLSARPG